MRAPWSANSAPQRRRYTDMYTATAPLVATTRTRGVRVVSTEFPPVPHNGLVLPTYCNAARLSASRPVQIPTPHRFYIASQSIMEAALKVLSAVLCSYEVSEKVTVTESASLCD